MEMMIIAVVALLAFAIVLVPLFRRGVRDGDAREFDGPATTDPVHGEGVVPPMAAGPATPVDAAGTTRVPDPTPPSPPAGGENELELEVQRYRAAVRAGTVCAKCGQANPADSRFCFECGAALPLAEAREFD